MERRANKDTDDYCWLYRQWYWAAIDWLLLMSAFVKHDRENTNIWCCSLNLVHLKQMSGFPGLATLNLRHYPSSEYLHLHLHLNDVAHWTWCGFLGSATLNLPYYLSSEHLNCTWIFVSAIEKNIWCRPFNLVRILRIGDLELAILPEQWAPAPAPEFM